MQPLLTLELNVDFPAKPGVLRDLRLQIHPGEIVGFAGQSGCGKSTVALSILRLLPRNAAVRGSVHFRGRDLLQCSAAEMRSIRGKQIALALQAASSALNPYLRIETHMREAWCAHESVCWAMGRRRALETLAALDLPADEAFLRRYPREISLGQAQRVVLATALLHRPALLIADEPTSALDLVSQIELLKLLKKVNAQHGLAMLYISHDLGTVRNLCHRVCVLNEGKVVESSTPEQLFHSPAAGFTQSLIAAHEALNVPSPTPYSPQKSSISE